MSKYNGVNKHFLFGHMIMADDDDAPDGAWWAMLQSAAADCMGIEADDDMAFDAVHDYIAYCNTEEGARILGRLMKLQTYDVGDYEGQGMRPHGDGEWLRLDDVQDVLKKIMDSAARNGEDVSYLIAKQALENNQHNGTD